MTPFDTILLIVFFAAGIWVVAESRTRRERVVSVAPFLVIAAGFIVWWVIQ